MTPPLPAPPRPSGTDRVHDGERLVSWLQSVGVNREVAVTEVDVQDSGSLGPLVRGQDLCIRSSLSAMPSAVHVPPPPEPTLTLPLPP